MRARRQMAWLTAAALWVPSLVAAEAAPGAEPAPAPVVAAKAAQAATKGAAKNAAEDAAKDAAAMLKQPTRPAAAPGGLTAETMATKPKPKGFRYSILRDMWVDDLSETLLYVKKRKKAQSSRAIPIPKDRKLLDSCIAGGTSADLKRGATVTVKFDPKGVVRPEIVLSRKVKVEVLHGKVLDIGGPKLYLSLDDGSKRGFAVQTYADWNDVVQNGDAKHLVKGAAVTVRFDPSGEKGLEITLDQAPVAEAKPSGGCGCQVNGPAPGPSGGAAALVLCAALALLRRRDATR